MSDKEEFHVTNTNRVPLHFDGRVKMGMEKDEICYGVKLTLHRAGRKIM